MNVVIQCAASKAPHAGHMVTEGGERVLFVADPTLANPMSGLVYAHPDGTTQSGLTWRERLLAYNKEPGKNPLGLLPAGELYTNPAYGIAVQRFGEAKVFILSAGWGLIGADFLTPAYDITFSSSAEKYKRRQSLGAFQDFDMVGTGSQEPAVFLGGKDYLPLFLDLTHHYTGRRVVFYNSERVPAATADVEYVRYQTAMRTNWHYDAVKALADGRIEL